MRQKHENDPVYDLPSIPYYLACLLAAEGQGQDAGPYHSQAKDALGDLPLVEPRSSGGPTLIAVVLRGRAPIIVSRPEPVSNAALEIIEKQQQFDEVRP